MSTPKELTQLRDQLDVIDRKLVKLLAERFKVTEVVGHYKKQNNLPAQDLAREKIQLERIAKLAKESGLDEDFAKKMLRLIIDEVVVNHKRIFKGNK